MAQKQSTQKQLSVEDVRHIAALAQIELNTDQEKRLLENLNQILSYFEQIDGVDTSKISAMSHSLVFATPFAEDVTSPGLPLEKVLLNAPDQQDSQVRVPAVIEE